MLARMSPAVVPRLAVAWVVLSVSACHAGGDAPDRSSGASAGAGSAAQAPPTTTKRYGDRIRSSETIKLASMLERPADYRGRAVTVEGAVRRACTKRGCWMELSPGMDAAAPGCRVRFKDYGFFIPTDSAGAHARVQGVVQVRTLAAPIVSHYESEGAHFANKHPDGSADEVQMIASGVELTR